MGIVSWLLAGWLAASAAPQTGWARPRWSPPWTPWTPFPCSGPDARSAADNGAGTAAGAPRRLSDEEVARRVDVELRAVLFGSRWQALADDYGRSALDALGLGRFLDPPAGNPTRSALAEALRTGAVEARVERVVDWRRHRCSEGPDRRMMFYVEATWRRRPADGTQAGSGPPRRFNVLLGADGTLHQWGMGAALSDDAPLGPALASLDEAGAVLAGWAGGPLEHLQYVLATGYPSCSSTPCVAGSRGDRLYILDHRGFAFAFALEPRPRDEVLPPPGHTCIGAPCAGDPWVLEINGHWLAGEPLNPPAGRDRSGSTP